MSSHIDIVANNPLSAEETLLASLVLEDDTLSLHLSGAKNDTMMWDYLRSRTTIDPDKEPKQFLEALPEAIDATYVYASQVHSSSDCPFVSN
jgi:hypothetical protein